MKPDEYIEDKPKNHFEWGYLYKVYLVILIAVFLLALANQANAGVFLEINSNMDYYESQMPLGDIMQNSDTWDAVAGYMNDVHGVPFPTYSEATQMDDLLENVLMYYVGQYCNVSGTVAQQVYDTCTDIADTASQVWDYISLDLESGDFIATPNHSGDLSDVIHGVVDPLIYDEGSQAGSIVEGTYWVTLPSNIYYGYIYNKVENMYSTVSNTYFCLVRQSSNRVVLYWSSSNSGGYVYSGEFIPSSGILMNTTYSVNGNIYYYGGWANEYRTDWRLGSSSGQPLGIYSDVNTALAALWGSGGPSSDPVLNGDGYIINENPTFAPLSGFSALNYPYRTKIVENHTNTSDPDDPVGYPQGVNTVEPNTKYTDIPTWLVDPTVDIPEEPDYLQNVDVELPEIEPDTGFITDVYNALPSGIVSMIAVGLGLGVVMKIIS